MNTYGALQHIAASTSASRSSLNRSFIGDDLDESSRYTTAIDRTPLLRPSLMRNQRSIAEDRRRRREAILNWKVGILLLIFLFGATIGGYLLISDNIDHHEDFPYYLIDLDDWYEGTINKNLPQLPLENIGNLIISHTRSISCRQFNHCKNVINNTLINRNLFDIPFNFLISKSGETYEIRGWLFTSGFTNNRIHKDSIAVGFIGDFTNSEPTNEQINELHAFIAMARRRKQLKSNFKVFGARSNETDGEKMFKRLSEFTQWQGFV